MDPVVRMLQHNVVVKDTDIKRDEQNYQPEIKETRYDRIKKTAMCVREKVFSKNPPVACTIV